MTDDRERAPRHGGNVDGDERLRAFFREAHADDRPPPFRRLARATAAPPRPRIGRWRSALAATAVAAIALGIGWWATQPVGDDAPLSEADQIALARELSSWDAPLDFLLETPGSELLTAPPSFELLDLALPPDVEPADSGETTP